MDGTDNRILRQEGKPMHMQNPNRLRNAGLALMLALWGAACVPVFRNPIAASPDLKPDPALLGTWSSVKDGGDGTQVSFFPRKDGWLDIVFLADLKGNSDSGLDLTLYEGYTTTIEDDHVLCFRERPEKPEADEPASYLLATYRVDPPTRLDVRLFANAAVRAAIESGALEGTVTTNVYADTITVTSSSARLLAAVVTQGAAAFTEPDQVMRFERMEPVGAGAADDTEPADK
jgi:hypothetical protein